MHQPILESDLPPRAETAALRQRIRRALASDLQLPEKDPAVTATIKALTLVARQQAAFPMTRRAAAHTTLDTWWRIVAHTHALSRR